MIAARRKPLVIDTDGPSSATQDLLRTALQVAVPLWIERLRHQSVEHLLERAKICGQAIAEKGDIIQWRGKKAGASAEAFNRLAEGLACLALVADGGVKFLGVRWEVRK